MSSSIISPQIVQHIAKLANLTLTAEEVKKLSDGFNTTLEVVDQLKKIPVDGVKPTFQVTGLTNIWREDVVDEERMFTQEQALLNAKETHAGYFVVPQIIDQDI